tara:strand:+ start:225 stop:434 length:210 start_codon:yes stop_codon:yes gene_type:complete
MTTTGDIRIRVSKDQKEQLINLAEANGFRTLSDFVRSKIFDKDLSLHSKVNSILSILEDKNEGNNGDMD